jgi:hypothetical protein
VNGNATLFNNVGHVYDYENRVLQAGFIQADYRQDGKRAWKQPGDRSTRTYYVYDGERVILEFNPANGFYQAYAYGANGLSCSERQDGHLVYAFDPAGNLVHRLRDGTVLSNSWFDSYGGLLYDDSATGVRPYPSPDSVGYQGQWGAYTDVENRALHLRLDYYSAAYARWLTRQSAGVNEYSAGVNPVHSWVDPLQDLLSLVGVFDPTGAVDVVNAVGYALRGKWGSAAVTALGIIPYVGDVAKAGKAGHAVALATRGARQAARGAEGASQRAIVIGENMNRVRNAAKALGASYYRAWRIEPFDAQRALRRNEAWIRRKVREGYLIYDIGIDLARDYRSPFYAMERRVLREMGVEPVPIYWPPSDSLRLFSGH